MRRGIGGEGERDRVAYRHGSGSNGVSGWIS